jgi:hypothetical protein
VLFRSPTEKAAVPKIEEGGGVSPKVKRVWRVAGLPLLENMKFILAVLRSSYL